MENDIIDYLKKDKELIELLKGDNIMPLFTTDIDKPSLIYNFMPIEIDHLSQSQLELRIIYKDYDYCKVIENRINKILSFKEDDPYKINLNTKFKSYLSGGGCLYRDDIEVYENTLNFVLNWREIYVY